MMGAHHLSEVTLGNFWEVLEQCSSHRAQICQAKFPDGRKHIYTGGRKRREQRRTSNVYALTTQGAILRLAISSPERSMEKQNAKPPADLLNQNLHANKIPK